MRYYKKNERGIDASLLQPVKQLKSPREQVSMELTRTLSSHQATVTTNRHINTSNLNTKRQEANTVVVDVPPGVVYHNTLANASSPKSTKDHFLMGEIQI